MITLLMTGLLGADNFQIDVNGDGVAVVTMDFKGMKVEIDLVSSVKQAVRIVQCF